MKNLKLCKKNCVLEYLNDDGCHIFIDVLRQRILKQIHDRFGHDITIKSPLIISPKDVYLFFAQILHLSKVETKLVAPYFGFKRVKRGYWWCTDV